MPKSGGRTKRSIKRERTRARTLAFPSAFLRLLFILFIFFSFLPYDVMTIKMAVKIKERSARDDEDERLPST